MIPTAMLVKVPNRVTNAINAIQDIAFLMTGRPKLNPVNVGMHSYSLLKYE